MPAKPLSSTATFTAPIRGKGEYSGDSPRVLRISSPFTTRATPGGGGRSATARPIVAMSSGTMRKKRDM